MRKFLTLALTVGLLSGAMTVAPVVSTDDAPPAAVAEAHPAHDFSRWAKSECRYGPFGPDSHVIMLIRCAHRKVGQVADTATSLMIANNESGYEPRAYNSSSGAGGIYQWLASSWPGRSRFPKMWRQYDLGADSRFNPRAAVFVSAKVMAGPGGFGPWCGFTTYC